MNISCFTDDLLRVRACTAILEGRFRSAKKLLQKSLDTFRQSGSKDGIALTLCELAHLDRLQDRCDTAESSLAEAMELIRQMDSRRYLASGLQESVFLATAQARHERAVERLGKLEALREEIGMPLTPRSRGGWERAIEISRTALGEKSFSKVREEGRLASLDRVHGKVSQRPARLASSGPQRRHRCFVERTVSG